MDASASSRESDRLRILQLVSDGKVKASEGVNLLDALNNAPKNKGAFRAAHAAGSSQGELRWFRIKVTNIQTGRSKAVVNIPLTLAEWGLRFGARFAPEVGDVDLGELSQMLTERDLDGKIIDVVDEEDG